MENLERHVKDQHPKANVKLDKLLTATERQKAKTAKAPARPAMTRRGRRIVIVAGAVIAILIAVIVLYPRANVGLSVGQNAPDFTLVSTGGQTVRLSDVLALRNHPVLIEFMDVDCEFCVEQAPILASLYANYAGRVTFYSIDVNFKGSEDTKDRIDAFKATHQSSWDYLNAAGSTFDQGVVNAYQVTGTPTTFVLNRTGFVSPIQCPANQGGPSHCAGLASYDILRDALDYALRS